MRSQWLQHGAVTAPPAGTCTQARHGVARVGAAALNGPGADCKERYRFLFPDSCLI